MKRKSSKSTSGRTNAARRKCNAGRGEASQLGAVRRQLTVANGRIGEMLDALYVAAAKGSLVAAGYLVGTGQRDGTLKDDDFALLKLAGLEGREGNLAKLLDAHMSEQDRADMQFIDCIRRDDLEGAKAILASGASASRFGGFCLVLAVKNSSPSAIRLCLEHGAGYWDEGSQGFINSVVESKLACIEAFCEFIPHRVLRHLVDHPDPRLLATPGWQHFCALVKAKEEAMQLESATASASTRAGRRL